VLKYKNGVIATIDCGFDSQACLLTEISGTKGSLMMRDTFLDTEVPIVTVMNSTGTVTHHEIAASKRYEDEVNAVTQAVLEGKKEVLPLVESVRFLFTYRDKYPATKGTNNAFFIHNFCNPDV
jgi:D-xylose 1-dehydrogenase (NADP+, D-xylono-1,5-lactone-forming)